MERSWRNLAMGLFLLSAPICRAAPQLRNERIVLPDIAGSVKLWGIHLTASAQLSPDAGKLLYVRVERVAEASRPAGGGAERDNQPREPARPRLPGGRKPGAASAPARVSSERCRFVLRDVQTGKETVIPTPPFADADLMIPPLTAYAFDPSGSRALAVTGIDSNGDGAISRDADRVEPILFEPASGAVRGVNVPARLVWPVLDRLGNGIVFFAEQDEPGASKLAAASPPDFPPRQLKVAGAPREVCPAADLLPVVVLPSRDAKGTSRAKLLLCDLSGVREPAELPLSYELTGPAMRCCWSTDGRYLYYADGKDVLEGFPRAVVLTRVWDRLAGKELAAVENAVPVGPGPTTTTVVLVRQHMAAHSGSRARAPRSGEGMLLYDVVAGRSTAIALEGATLRFARGRNVLYDKLGRDGRLNLYAAELVP